MRNGNFHNTIVVLTGLALALAIPGKAVTSVTLSPTSLTFGNQVQGTTSAAKTLTLTNIATSTLTITSIAVSGAILARSSAMWNPKGVLETPVRRPGTKVLMASSNSWTICPAGNCPRSPPFPLQSEWRSATACCTPLPKTWEVARDYASAAASDGCDPQRVRRRYEVTMQRHAAPLQTVPL
jgi:hypothetical protein